MSIIESFLDIDQYKLTSLQAIYHLFPDTVVRYKFKCRNENVDFSSSYEEIKEEINNLSNLKLAQREFNYLNLIRYFKKDFLYFLQDFRLKPKQFVKIEIINRKLEIEIYGPWIQSTLFEIYILAIVSEIYFKNMNQKSKLDWRKIGQCNLDKKIEYLNNAPKRFGFSDFGTRRRYSKEWQNYILPQLKETGKLVGTSNVYFAMEHDLTPIGSMPHEWVQAGQAMAVRLINSQKYMLEAWAKEYRGDLGIALTDTIGIDAFLKDFDLYFAKLYDGCRHDSGDPYEWGGKVINHYKELKIDSKTKSAIWSDNLDIPKAINIYNTFNELIKCGFGIGTNITNDVGFEPLNIVIKMVECNGQPVAKLSDSKGKTMCEDENYVKYLKNVFGRE